LDFFFFHEFFFTLFPIRAFGTVEVAKHIRTKAIIAIKKVPHVTQKNRMANIREIEFLKKLKGAPSIVKYYASYRHEDEIWVIYCEWNFFLKAFR